MRKFKHYNPKSIDEAVEKLQEFDGKSFVNAGGTDLLGTLRFELLEEYPEAIINLKSIAPSLAYIKEEGGMLKIGALTTRKMLQERYSKKQIRCHAEVP
jgi:xanthine dehydrogenase YagS FAD-binding subunit